MSIRLNQSNHEKSLDVVAAGQLRPRGPESTIQPRRVPQSRQFGGVSATSNDPTTPEPRRINETPRVLLPPQSKGRRVDS